MAWTTPKTWTNAAVTFAEFNTHIRDNENWLKGALTQLNVTSDSAKAKITPALCGAHVYKAADMTPINNGTPTAINFDTERFDSDAFHSTSVNNTRITIPSGMSGYYITGGGAVWSTNATGNRVLYIRLNGVTILGLDRLLSGGASTAYGQSATTLAQLSAADYIELIADQSSGVALSITALGDYSPQFWIHRMSST